MKRELMWENRKSIRDPGAPTRPTTTFFLLLPVFVSESDQVRVRVSESGISESEGALMVTAVPRIELRFEISEIRFISDDLEGRRGRPAVA
jgi:hypothetical protein